MQGQSKDWGSSVVYLMRVRINKHQIIGSVWISNYKALIKEFKLADERLPFHYSSVITKQKAVHVISLIEIATFLNVRFSWWQLELLAARNLISANLNGTSDPYAIIECGTQKRFRWLLELEPSYFIWLIPSITLLLLMLLKSLLRSQQLRTLINYRYFAETG